MISMEMERLFPSAKTLVKDRAASRVHAKDATLYAFDPDAQTCAQQFMGWTDLASNPPLSLTTLQEYADDCRSRGLDTVILIGQGGSSGAAMALTKYHKQEDSVRFRVLDSVSPVRVRQILDEADLEHTLFLVSSKSGGTIEMRSLLAAVRHIFEERVPEGDIKDHLVAITDPHSPLQRLAEKEDWAGIFLGEPSVGGRFSALSVFGLLPAALAGIDITSAREAAAKAEQRCQEDSIDNPAIMLAAYLYDNYVAGRDKLAMIMPRRARVLGLWIEQLVAESLGKAGEGILPVLEVDPLLLVDDTGDRMAVSYQLLGDSWDEQSSFALGLAQGNAQIPRVAFQLNAVSDVCEQFVLWEYAVALCGYLMHVCPFDQPDVAQAKSNVLEILERGLPDAQFEVDTLHNIALGTIKVRVSDSLKMPSAPSVESALTALFESVASGDYFALNAFLPFTGQERKRALETMRHEVADALGIASCLEVGPRFLHSTGQLQKGGSDTGVFLVLSADELKDIPLHGEAASSLALLGEAQATGDALTLAERGRRVVHLHLPDNSAVTLRCLANVIRDILRTLN